MWTLAKVLRIPLDKKIETLADVPYTISFILKKRMQVDSINELPKEKRPPEMMIWDGTYDDIEEWLDKVFDRKKKKDYDIELVIKDDDIG